MFDAHFSDFDGSGPYSLQVYTQHAYMRPYGVSTMLQLGVKLFPAGDFLRILLIGSLDHVVPWFTPSKNGFVWK